MRAFQDEQSAGTGSTTFSGLANLLGYSKFRLNGGKRNPQKMARSGIGGRACFAQWRYQIREVVPRQQDYSARKPAALL